MNASHFAAATAADADRFLESVNMQVGAYTLDNLTIPTDGARKVTLTHVSGGTEDTLGTVTIVGHNLAGQLVTEELTPVADSEVSSSGWFTDLVSATGAGWVIDAVEGTEDTITIGYGAAVVVADGSGVLGSVVIGTTAAGAITLADAGGTISILKASIVEGTYTYGCNYRGYLQVTVAGASDVTIIHSESNPTYQTT